MLLSPAKATHRAGPDEVPAPTLSRCGSGPRNGRNVKGLSRGPRIGFGGTHEIAAEVVVWACCAPHRSRHSCSPPSLARRPRHAVEAVNVRTDVTAIDLTGVAELVKTDTDTIAGVGRARRRRHRAPHAAAGTRGLDQLGGVRARQFRRRADRPADRGAALPHGRLRPVPARPRPLAHRHHHAELGRAARAAVQRHRRHLPHHARSRHGRHLRRGAAHRPAAAALSVGARRLQGQDQQLHALPRHRHRHRRIAGAVPDHPVRGQGQRDVPGGRGARLGGAGLYRHRLRLLGQGVRHVVGRRAHLARLGRGDPGRHAAGVPVRLSQSQSLARALHAHHARLARGPRARSWRSR